MPPGQGENWNTPDHAIVSFIDNHWQVLQPQPGWCAGCIDEQQILLFRGDDWISAVATRREFEQLGVKTEPDDTNRLSVKSEFVLFSHADDTASQNVNLSLNKRNTANKATILFQDQYSGRAEIGLLGNNDLTFKTSVDGQDFSEAFSIDAQSQTVTFKKEIDAPLLMSGVPSKGLSAYDRFYIDPVSGNDLNSGTSVSQAWKSVAALATKLPVGRSVEISLLRDITWDYYLAMNYPIQKLFFRGYSANGQSAEQRKIKAVNAKNASGYPGQLHFKCPATVFFFQIEIELSTDATLPFLHFDGTQGFIQTYKCSLSRTGAGAAPFFGTHRAYIPSNYEQFTLAPSAQGYVATGVGPGENPNTFWNFPSSLTSF